MPAVTHSTIPPPLECLPASPPPPFPSCLPSLPKRHPPPSPPLPSCCSHRLLPHEAWCSCSCCWPWAPGTSTCCCCCPVLCVACQCCFSGCFCGIEQTPVDEGIVDKRLKHRLSGGGWRTGVLMSECSVRRRVNTLIFWGAEICNAQSRTHVERDLMCTAWHVRVHCSVTPAAVPATHEPGWI